MLTPTQTPWHLWGNSQTITAPANAFTNPNRNDQRITLNRVQYGRPETWRFLFSYRLISGPNAPVNQANVSVWIDLLTGIGRSVIRIPFWLNLPSINWSGGNFPIGVVEWRNQTERAGTEISPGVFETLTSDQIVGQDITAEVTVSFTTDLPGTPPPVVVEVSGQWSPSTHVRPDWYLLDKELAEQFPGGEIGAR